MKFTDIFKSKSSRKYSDSQSSIFEDTYERDYQRDPYYVRNIARIDNSNEFPKILSDNGYSFNFHKNNFGIGLYLDEDRKIMSFLEIPHINLINNLDENITNLILESIMYSMIVHKKMIVELFNSGYIDKVKYMYIDKYNLHSTNPPNVYVPDNELNHIYTCLSNTFYTSPDRGNYEYDLPKDITEGDHTLFENISYTVFDGYFIVYGFSEEVRFDIDVLYKLNTLPLELRDFILVSLLSKKVYKECGAFGTPTGIVETYNDFCNILK